MGKRRGQGRWSAVFTIIKCNWGIGMMAMPFMLNAAGTISGVIMFVASMLLTQFAIVNLIATKLELSKTPRGKTAPAKPAGASETVGLLPSINNDGGTVEMPDPNRRDLDYSTVMAKALGPLGDWGALFSIVLSSYGSNVAYVLFIYDNMKVFYPHALRHGTDWIWIQIVPLICLAWFDSIGFMAPFSLFGLLCAFSFATLAVYNSASTIDPHEFVSTLEDEPFIKPDSFFLALSIAAFCNEGIVVLSPSTHSSMARPETYTWTAFWGICFFIVCYMAVGISGNILDLYNGEEVEAEMSLNFNTTGPRVHLYQASVILYSFQLIPTYAVVFFVAYEALEGKFLRHHGIDDRIGHLKDVRKKIPFFINRAFWVVMSGVIALQIPRFGDYLGLIGALANSLAIYIMPQVAYLRIVPPQDGVLDQLRRLGCYALTLFGAVLAIVGTYVSAAGMFNNSSHHHNNTVVGHYTGL